FFFQAEDGIRDFHVTGVQRVLFRSVRNERGAMAGVKTTSYAENVVSLARAHAAGAGEAVFADTRGRLCEGTGSNVFVVRGGRIKIGRASCRERVESSVVAGCRKKQD